MKCYYLCDECALLGHLNNQKQRSKCAECNSDVRLTMDAADVVVIELAMVGNTTTRIHTESEEV